MPTLNEMQKQIGELVVAKGFGNSPDDFTTKLLFAFIELGEAGDDFKKGLKKWKTEDEVAAAIGEELIDAIFYILDAMRVKYPQIDMDKMFEYKLAKNWGRPYRYGEDVTNVVQHASKSTV